MSHDDSMSGLDFRDFLTIGGFVVTCLLIGLGAGWWADARLGTTPVLTLLGLAVGVAGGIVGTWFRIRPLLSEDVSRSGPADGSPTPPPRHDHREGPR